MLARAAVARARELVDQLGEAESAVAGSRVIAFCNLFGEREGAVAWMAFGRDGKVTLRRAPLEVGPVLRDALFAGRESVVMTSATLAVSRSFEYFRERVGLPSSRLMELVLESPFDFLHQALVCLPTDLPPPGDPDFEAAVAEAVEGIARALDGRTLVLFTSNQQLAAVSDGLRERLQGDGIEVLAQGRGSGTRRVLAERFAAHPAAVLCGTASFWEGLDLPGRSLACVVVVRLPFRSPGDPVVRARGSLVRDSFLQLALPEAVLRLKQGFGRLIRRATDRGAVVILDGRVLTRNYGVHFLESLPECAAFTGPRADLAAAISEWVGERRPVGLGVEKPRRRVALAQCAPKLGDVDANLDLHLRLIEEAAAGGTDLCVFPELSLTGYFLKDLVPDLAMTLDHPAITRLAEASRGVDVVFGTVLRSDDFRYFNAAVHLSGGEVAHVHRKVYLPTYGMFDEQRYFAEGDRIRAYERNGVKSGILVCEDMWHLSTSYLLGVQGIHLLLCPSASPGRGVLASHGSDDLRSAGSWDDLCRTVAEYMTCYVVYCNRVGYEDGVHFHGGSSVHGPDGQRLVGAEEHEGLVTTEIDIREVERQRLATPLLADEKVDFTLRELQRVLNERVDGPY